MKTIDPKMLERLRKLGGDDLLRRMVNLFGTFAEPKLHDALAAYRAGDLDGVERAAHSLKSSAANLGAQRVYELADKAERMASERIDAGLGAVLEELAAAFGRAKQRLQEERSAPSNEEDRNRGG